MLYVYSLVCKGSPEVISTLCKSSLPTYYNSTYLYYCNKGYRVLAMGYKVLNNYNPSSSSLLSLDECRSEYENDLIFGGFIIIDNDIKASSYTLFKTLISTNNRVYFIIILLIIFCF